MAKWVNIQDCMPEPEIPCFLAVRDIHSEMPETYPISAAWNGSEWVDANGDVVNNVEFWQELPKISRVEITIRKLMNCAGNDKCENNDCCYFATLDELGALLRYIREKED